MPFPVPPVPLCSKKVLINQRCHKRNKRNKTIKEYRINCCGFAHCSGVVDIMSSRWIDTVRKSLKSSSACSVCSTCSKVENTNSISYLAVTGGAFLSCDRHRQSREASPGI